MANLEDKEPVADNVTSGQPPAGVGYGYGYNGNYGNNYGPGYGETPSFSDMMQTRTLSDWIAMFRERIWYLILSVFVVVTGTLIYTYNVVPEYTASARLRVLKNAVQAAPGSGANTTSLDAISGQEDFQTQLEIMRSGTIVKRVQSRLTSPELTEVVRPYQGGNVFSGPLTPTEVIAKHRNVVPQKATFIAFVEYTHRRPEVAEKLANYFAEEIQKYNSEDRANLTSPVIETTRVQIEQMEHTLAQQREERNLLIKNERLLTTEMGTANAELSSVIAVRDTERKNYEDQLAIRNEIQKTKEAGLSLLSQPAITSNQLVATLLPRVADLRISITGLLEKYGKNHPTLIAQTQQLEQAEAELAEAVKKAEAEFDSNFVAAKRRYESAQKRAEEKEAQLVRLRDAISQLSALDKKILLNEELLQRLKFNLEDLKMRVIGSVSSIVSILDPAVVPTRASNKNFVLNAIFGVVAGLAIGSGIIVLLSFFDDRIKSTRDVESFLNIPLLGTITQLRHIKSPVDKACIVSNGKDRGATEAFRAVYSALKIGEQSRLAKVFLVTSTMPSEGKTFVSTNLAQTYAAHGERVLVLDADLRLPNVGNSLGLTKDERGLTRYMEGSMTLDEAIIRDVRPNFDVLQVGAYCKNPTQIINSQKFRDMLEELKTRYDRIVVDTPPIGAVSDVLNLLPLCDGIVYTVRFNTVQRTMIKNNLHRIQESKIPVFGAVMNQMVRETARYYVSSGQYGMYSKYYHSAQAKEVEVQIDKNA
ncbi:MAG: polysaccharide biosynthesis tyrosine autokinase [Opitutales bacterium]|nr:polysaccharide biosynthesis tyrosine autokinase [Opitutales bacterium]